jgi:DNA phosphorothioation-dependent restriction protein DptH
MHQIPLDLLTNEILSNFVGMENGHCVRIDFLQIQEALEVCENIAQRKIIDPLNVYVLSTEHNQTSDNDFFITIDKAIELRNRKQGRLCLFIPADSMDAAFSSLSNSFAVLDGRKLHDIVLRRLKARLPGEMQSKVQEVFNQFRSLKVSKDWQMDFVCAALDRVQRGEEELIGLDLWHVGLIVDARPDFADFLVGNRQCVQDLARPGKFHSAIRERVQGLGVDTNTVTKLTHFFQHKTMQNVPEWSKELLQEHFTYDRWIFPQKDHSDIRQVMILPFLDNAGNVEKNCKLKQPDNTSGSLFAHCGKKETMVVRWKCDPPKPKNLSRWRVEIVPFSDELELEDGIELFSRLIPGHRSTLTIKLDLELEEMLDFSVVVHVTPIDATGNDIKDHDSGETIFGVSDEFYIVPETGGSTPPLPPRESRISVPTIAYGRLDEAMRTREGAINEVEPQWSNKDLKYFSMKVGDRHVLNIGLSGVLRSLEKKVISNSQSGGIFVLKIDEMSEVTSDEFLSYAIKDNSSDTWSPFWKARENFFARLRRDESRDVIEAAVWTPELAGAAIRYAQTYNELLQNLIQYSTSREELLEALSLDSVLIRIQEGEKVAEEALVTLPTHPLRAAWIAGYTQLLRKWEEALLELPVRERKNAVDMDAIRLLMPTNVPAFSFHIASSSTSPFVFFQNLRFFHGVHLPAAAPDPHRRFGDIAIILGAELDQVPIGDIQPEKLVKHLRDFLDMHPYANPLVTTLINPDRGEFFAEALKILLQQKAVNDNDDTMPELPKFHITSYVEDERKSTVQALEHIRQVQFEGLYSNSTDYFLPSLTTTLRHIGQLAHESLPDAHIAIVTDFTRPVVSALLPSTDEQNEARSFALYGLINRFVPQFAQEEDGFVWRYHIVSENGKPVEKHPVRPQYSDVLVELQTTLLSAGGKLLSGDAQARPVLEVRLEAERRRLLERLHNNSNWVITLDRFFALDYYDSPHAPGLSNVARKYVLDYSPEFAEGLGHRMMVTTSWHEEIGSLLRQAMEEQGFEAIEESVSRLLHYLKTVSGSLALQALESTTNASAAVGLGVVTAWLQKEKRLGSAVLLPVDLHPRLFSKSGSNHAEKGERRCDLVLVTLKRNIVEVTFIEVKWRRGRAAIEPLAEDMVLQMESTKQAMEYRFFSKDRIDGALQRSYLANVLRFYFERSRRYQLFDPKIEALFLENLTKLEKDTLDFRASYEGYIVSLDSEAKKRFEIKDAKIRVLTVADFDQLPDFHVSSAQSQIFLEGKSSLEQDVDVYIAEEDGALDQDMQIEEEVNQEESLVAIAGENLSDEVIIPLGTSTSGTVDWKPSTKGSPHLFIVGISGQGKSWATLRLLSELGRQGVPSLVLDFHGQFADDQGYFVKAVHPTVLDAAAGLPFSPFESVSGTGPDSWKANTYAIADIFSYVVGLGDIQQDALYQAIRDAYREKGFEETSLAEHEYPTLEEVSAQLEKQEKGRHGNNVAARCRSLLEMDLFRPVKGTADLLALIRQGLVIDLHNVYIEKQQLAAGAFVLRKLYKDMFFWGPTERIRLAIVLDEAHRLARDTTLPKIMKEGRKFGIAVIVASQGIDDFHPDVLENAGTKIIFRTNYPQSKKIAGFIRARHGQDIVPQIEQLGVGTAFVQTPEMQYSVKVHMSLLE